jgi:hypothetical protein
MTRELRVARNHTLFREVNERIYSLTEEFGYPAADGLRLAVVCECGNVDCTPELQIETDAYSRIREDPSRFIVLAGHDLAEPVVESGRGYVVEERADTPRVEA